MAQRLIQNFRRCRAILWASASFKAEVLERTLSNLGVNMVRVEQIDGTVLNHDRDIVFLDADQAISPSALFAVGSSLPAAPVVGIVGVEAPSRLRLLAEAGGTAILRKPIQAASVYSALFLSVNNYRRLRTMELRIAEQARKRHGRRFIVKAIVALVQAHGIGDEEAYAQLRRESMRRRIGIEEFCESLLRPDSDFPYRWPVGSLTTSPSRQKEEHSNAEQGRCETNAPFTGTERRIDDADDIDDGQGRGPNQARRA